MSLIHDALEKGRPRRYPFALPETAVWGRGKSGDSPVYLRRFGDLRDWDLREILRYAVMICLCLGIMAAFRIFEFLPSGWPGRFAVMPWSYPVNMVENQIWGQTPVLSGVIISGAEKLAIINGELMRVGDSVGRSRLADIGPSGVTLKFGRKKTTLKL